MHIRPFGAIYTSYIPPNLRGVLGESKIPHRFLQIFSVIAGMAIGSYDIHLYPS